MASYKLLLKASAAKEIEAISSKRERQRVVARIRALAADPRPRGSQKLAGHRDRYRVRQGPFRVVYLVDDAAFEVVVVKVGHRREVYR
ncbi:MAG TPA: type II toxin-antitoxin system RelE/ParE family toxin [Thermoanaerobaculia bacterium]|nr:type II toxin-antitoxin system RelE/ParE family toxin [Thermoanaerobaculia bacterium]